VPFVFGVLLSLALTLALAIPEKVAIKQCTDSPGEEFKYTEITEWPK
jgi:hypothetical protein